MRSLVLVPHCVCVRVAHHCQAINLPKSICPCPSAPFMLFAACSTAQLQLHSLVTLVQHTEVLAGAQPQNNLQLIIFCLSKKPTGSQQYNCQKFE